MAKSNTGSGPCKQLHHQRKSSTLDGDKKRLFLERMRTNPFHTGQNGSAHLLPPTSKAKHSEGPPLRGSSTGVEILTDDEIGLTCSNTICPPSTFFDLSGVTPPPLQPPLKPPNRQRHQQRFGFRSLSGESRSRVNLRDPRPLFGTDEVEDSPLLMSSIDGVTTQAGVVRSGSKTFYNHFIKTQFSIFIMKISERRRVRSGDEFGVFLNCCPNNEVDNSSKLKGQNHDSLFCLSTPNPEHLQPSSLTIGICELFIFKKVHYDKIAENFPGNCHHHTRDPNLSENNFYSLSDTQGAIQSSQNLVNANIIPPSSYMSLKTKIKAVQEKYRKSSMSDKIR